MSTEGLRNRDNDKPLVWLEGEVRTPPFTKEARIEAGMLLRRIQQGENLGLPHSRPMPSIGAGCRELGIQDKTSTWRIIYRIDEDSIVIGDVFNKKSQKTPKMVIDNCRRRYKRYDKATK